MEKVIAVLMRPEPDDDWCARQRAQVADACWDWALLGCRSMSGTVPCATH